GLATGSGSTSCRKPVKIRLVWSVTSDDQMAAGTGSDPQEQIAKVLAIQNMMDKLESENHLTRTLIDHPSQFVPCSWVLNSTDSQNEGETNNSVDIVEMVIIPPSESG